MQEWERLSPNRLIRVVSPRSQTEIGSGLGPLPGVTGSGHFLFATFLLIRFWHHLIIIWLKSFPLKSKQTKHLSSLLGDSQSAWFLLCQTYGAGLGMAHILSGLSHQGAGAPYTLLFTCGHFSPSFSLCPSPSGTKCQLVLVALFLGIMIQFLVQNEPRHLWHQAALWTDWPNTAKEMTPRVGYALWGMWSFTVICQWLESSSHLANQLPSTASLSDLPG